MVDPIQKAFGLKKLLEEFGIQVDIHKVNPLDFKECLLTILNLIQNEQNVDKAVNVTGGTKILSLAALSAAWLSGCRAFIIQEKGSGDIKVELPITETGYLNNISEQMKRILSYLLSQESKLEKPMEEYDDELLRPFITKNIANNLGVKSQSIISSLKVMEGEGLIRSRRGSIKRGEPYKGKAGIKLWWLTDEGKIYATLFKR
jgi:CRISPR-associated protein Csa3